MAENRGLALMQEAVRCLDKNNRDAFYALMKQADEELEKCPPDSPLHGERLLVRVISEEVQLPQMLETLLEAERKLGGTSRVIAPQSRLAENHYDVFYVWNREPGTAGKVGRWNDDIREILEVFQRLTGFGIGVEECYFAQLAYYRGEFDSALKYVEAGLERTKSSALANLFQAEMLEIQAGIAKHKMDRALWRSSYSRLQALATGAQPASRACQEQAEVICTMLEMSLGCLHEVPVWAKSGDFGVVPLDDGYEIVRDNLLAGTLSGAMVAHLEYLSYSSEPVRALQTAATLLNVLGIHNVLLDGYVHLLRAGCYFSIDKPDRARNAIREAMKYIVPDGLWTIAADFVPAFGEELYAVAAEFDPDAPAKIRSIGEKIYEKLTPLRNDMMRGTSEGLTKREREVADLAMKGHSNAEIAAELNVSVRTVRFHLENVYSKLNISRRSKFASEAEQSTSRKLADWVK